MSTHTAIAGVALLVILVTPRAALGFCRTSVCDLGSLGTICTPARETDCGVPLSWKERCVGFSIQRDGSSLLSAEEAGELVGRAFATWNAADCDGAKPHFFVKRQPDAVCATIEYNVDRNVNKGNANVVLFRDDAWPYPDFDTGLAFTTLTYNVVTGEIVDADIEINTAGSVVFTTSDTDVVYDLASTIQHETGHFLGIAHSPDPASPMFAEPEFGSTRHRELTPDDVDAICDAYPPEEPALAASCSPMPHDFSPLCNETLRDPDSLEDGGCAISAVPQGNSGALLAAIFATAYALLRRRTTKEKST